MSDDPDDDAQYGTDDDTADPSAVAPYREPEPPTEVEHTAPEYASDTASPHMERSAQDDSGGGGIKSEDTYDERADTGGTTVAPAYQDDDS